MADDSVAKAKADRLQARDANGPAWRRNLAAIIVLVGVGLALLALGIPRTVAAWANLAAQPTIRKIGLNQNPSMDELAGAVTELQRAQAWVSSPARFADLGTLELAQALLVAQGDPKRAEFLAQAERHLVEGLTAGPADGFAWDRLAVVRSLRGEPGRQVAVALAQSLDMAPNRRELWIPRAALFLQYWRFLTNDELLAMRSQFHTIWTMDPLRRLALLDLALQSRQLYLIFWALGEDAEAQAELQRQEGDLARPFIP